MLSCTSDEEWAACASLIGRPDLAAVPLDDAIAAWSRPVLEAAGTIADTPGDVAFG